MNMEQYNYPVAINVKKIIQDRGLKQYSVANLAGYKEKVFSDMLNGRRLIKSCDILKISIALGVTPNELFKKQNSL